MRLALLLSAAALALTATAAAAETQTWFGFQFGVSGGSAPPLAWRAEPHFVVVDAVDVVDDPRCDDDVFRYSGAWWRYSDGWWYRSASWRGPWRGVDVRVVPGAVLRVPDGRWKHHPHGGPPGLERAAYVHERNAVRRAEREDRREDRWQDDRRGNGRGNGRGHDKHDDRGDHDRD